MTCQVTECELGMQTMFQFRCLFCWLAPWQPQLTYVRRSSRYGTAVTAMPGAAGLGPYTGASSLSEPSGWPGGGAPVIAVPYRIRSDKWTEGILTQC